MRLKEIFVIPFFRLLRSRSEPPYLSCSLSITMRNVESRLAAFVLAYCQCVITKEKNQDEAGSPRKRDREPSEAEKTMRIQKEEEEVRRWASKKKRKASSAENEVKRDQEIPRSRRKRRIRKGEENIKDIARGTRFSERERTGRRRKEEEEKRSDTPKRRRRRRSSAKGEVVKMKMIEKMKR